jgi:ABC-type polysaccharide/polyol phosphate transport system ATPase subunit
MSSEIDLFFSEVKGESQINRNASIKDAELAIRVENVSKSYQIYDKPQDRLKQSIYPRLQRLSGIAPKQYHREFWALKNISFEIKEGETFGILGRNGAGKSTLLQIICGTLAPTAGAIETNGRIAALLELGAGFNPEFTGKENVYLNGQLLGMTKEEIDERYEEIVAFSGIGDFVNQPVKKYSSGMYARLAFSIAVQSNPRVLIVDEALSVGDMAFQEKSFSRMKEIRSLGTSILFVTHSIPLVRNFCDRAIWLDRGEIRTIGERLEVCKEYQQAIEEEIKHDVQSKLRVTPKAQRDGISRTPEANASGKTIEILQFSMDNDRYMSGDDIAMQIKLKFNKSVSGYGVGIIVTDLRGNIIAIINTLRDDIFLKDPKENVHLVIKENHFTPGEYSITISISDSNGTFSYDRLDACGTFIIEQSFSSKGLPVIEGFVRCDHEWTY